MAEPVRLVVGANFYDGDPDAMRRQDRALDALGVLRGVRVVDVQWEEGPSRRPWIRCVAALERDSTTVTGAAGRRKPIACDVADALAEVAERDGCRRFLFINSDIVVTPAAVNVAAAPEWDACGFSRMDQDAEGRDVGIEASGLDAFAFDVGWWRANRKRFRPYILGEPCWDNVYAAILMCHGRGLIANRSPLVRHEAHPSAAGATAFAEHNGILAAYDSRYFSLWAHYYAGLMQARAREASEAEERTLAREVFVWRRSPAAALWQAGRHVRARLRYRQRAAAWAAASRPRS